MGGNTSKQKKNPPAEIAAVDILDPNSRLNRVAQSDGAQTFHWLSANAGKARIYDAYSHHERSSYFAETKHKTRHSLYDCAGMRLKTANPTAGPRPGHLSVHDTLEQARDERRLRVVSTLGLISVDIYVYTHIYIYNMQIYAHTHTYVNIHTYLNIHMYIDI